MLDTNQPNYDMLIVYGMNDKEINAATLLVSLNSFLEILNKIYARINPDARIEFEIVAFNEGSFIVKIKEYFTKGEFSRDIRALAITILGSMIMDSSQLPNPVILQPENSGYEMTVSYHNQTFKIPANFYDEFKKLRRDESIYRPFNDAVYALQNDPKIKFISFVPDATNVKHEVLITREEFSKPSDKVRLNQLIKYHDDAKLEVLKIYYENNEVIGIFLWEGKIIISNIDHQKYLHNRYKLKEGNHIAGHLIEMNENDLYTNQLIHVSFKLDDIY